MEQIILFGSNVIAIVGIAFMALVCIVLAAVP
jgi:hypothetical protein